MKNSNQIALNPEYYTIEGSYISNQVSLSEKIIEDLIKKLSKNPLYEHKCQNCGGTVELQYDKAIFICPYCGSHYALAPNRINDKG